MAEVYQRIKGKPIEKVIAQLSVVQSRLAYEALFHAQKASGLLAARSKNRTGASSIVVERGDKTDWYVILDDTRGLNAALSIEYGREEKFDPETGEQTQWASDGLYIMADTFGLPRSKRTKPARGGDTFGDD